MLGRLGEASLIIAEQEATARTMDLGWVSAGVSRGRALLHMAEGDLPAALAAADDALQLIGGSPMLVERGRALLVKGRIQRRQKAKAAAKANLEEACETFRRAGADAWAVQARAELDRVGIRRSAPLELTPTERQVADLVERGLTNRAIADRAFLTPKSVEGVLSRIYRKMGVTSRTALVARLADQRRGPGEAEPGPPSG
jgi:DNA-binding CsgD family transcriptional regulator